MVFLDDESRDSDKTEVLNGNEIIIKKTLETFSWIKKSMDGVIDSEGPAIHILYEPIWSAIVSLKERGVKIRVVTEITGKNISYCKKLLEVCNVRHLDGVRTNFGIADGKQILLHGVSEEKDPLSQAIQTTVKGLVEAQQYMFENLWDKSIPAIQKIKEIEEGIKPEIIETISDPVYIKNMYLTLIKFATTEIILIIPTTNVLNHQIGIGVFNLLKEKTQAHENKNNVSIRILAPQINNYYYNIRQQQQQQQQLKEQNTLLSFSPSPLPIELRDIEAELTTKSIIIIIDRKESLVIEINDDLKGSFVDSVGFATYSNSRATVLSYVSIFESFWKQSELVKKLKESEELQKDFVHIAAHELKNPIQPILGLSSLLMKKIPTDEKDLINIIKIINRNARKLIQLTSDILDVTKIETNNLKLNRELFNLAELISDLIDDYNNQLDNENIKLEYEVLYVNRNDDDYGPEKKEGSIKKEIYANSLYALADKIRINQVISNLLDNAIHFTKEGIIKIIVERKYDEERVHINVKDSGSGIDPSIIRHLFSKFTTKSKGGTGLGLYISRKIVEAHCGKIWAKNNEDGEKGATFSFSLPLSVQ
jgi:two-component system sensor histidine kinase VicK